jgi:glycosyltransferase involved in cell wall biosynthesis
LGVEWEVVVVDDGSSDDTWKLLKEWRENEGERVKLIRLAKNYGQTLALKAGIESAQGEIIVTMDGDLQNDPHDIPKLIKKLEEGYDVVSGWRKERKDAFLTRRLPSLIGNIGVSAVSGLNLHDYGCTLKAYRSDIIKSVPLYGEMHRLIPALADWMGARVAEVEVSHRKRMAGESKYSLSRIFAVIIDLITLRFFSAYATRPTHVFGMWGIMSLLLSMVTFALLVYMKLKMDFDMTGNPFLIITVLLVIVGVQLIALGLLGELSVRTYFESLNKSPYRIREKIGD